jgi:gamma-glutamyltranspeptidase/glutathione hydrolase
VGAGEGSKAAPDRPAALSRVGPKPVVRGKKAVASSQHPIVTETMLDVLREGGTAADAGIAGCLVQATIQQEMTNHTGTVDFIFWEAKTGKAYELNSSGTLVSGLAPFRPLPPNLGVLIPAVPPCACIPGFMPGLKAIHERFASRPWGELCRDAVTWAEVPSGATSVNRTTT